MAAASSPPRRSFALRFSLRFLLLAFTAFAIGFPIWYRWPYEEDDPAAAKTAGMRCVITWQRQWGGGRLKHGPEVTYRKGKMVSSLTYRKGKRHGPCEFRQPNGAREVGQFVNEKKDGVWTLFDRLGKIRQTATWRNDRLDGPSDVVHSDGKMSRLLFVAGRLTSINGKPVNDYLSELLAAGKFDSKRVAHELTNDTKIEIVRTPLKDAIDFLSAQHGIPLVIDPQHGDGEIPVSAQFDGIQLVSALAILTSQHGHGCDYRYGIIWITSAEDAKNWRDPTGVAEIQPPKDSQLAKSWNEPVKVQVIDQPLAEVLQRLVQPLAIVVDISRIESANEGEIGIPVTITLDGIPFRDTLGILLYKTRCRVELEGETLVILPPADGP